MTLATNGVVHQNICHVGTLTFTARGTLAEQLYPLMTVSIGATPLLSTRVQGEKNYRVPIPKAGMITIAFHDDRYLPDNKPPEDRNLFISNWQFQPAP